MNDLITTQFYEYLDKFLNELSKSSKKIKKVIEEKYCDIHDPKYIDMIKLNIYTHKTQFLGKESDLDEFFKNNSIELLDSINISDIWAKSASDNKSAIIQYIKVFVFMFESSNKNEDSTSEEEEEEEKEKETGENEENTSDNNFEDMLKKSLLEEDENMKSFYDNLHKEDNSILNLAKNIAGELKNDNNGGLENVMDMFKNGEGLNSLVSKITSKLDTKIKSGEIDQSQLLGDAQKMMSGNNNLFGNMFNNLNKNNMFKESQQSSTNNTTDVKNVEIEEVSETKKKSKKNRKKKSKK